MTKVEKLFNKFVNNAIDAGISREEIIEVAAIETLTMIEEELLETKTSLFVAETEGATMMCMVVEDEENTYN